MTRKEMFFELYSSVVQGILEAKLGIIGEIAPAVLADDALRITDALFEKVEGRMENLEKEGGK